MKYYVNAGAGKDGDGSENRPFKHINDAAQAAMPGDEVLVYPGIYREYVNPRNAGTEEDRITYRSLEPLGAVITGAELLASWEQYEGDVWTARVHNGILAAIIHTRLLSAVTGISHRPCVTQDLFFST